MEFEGYVIALGFNEELRLGQIYFKLPESMLKRLICSEDLARLAVKASKALDLSLTMEKRSVSRRSVRDGATSREREEEYKSELVGDWKVIDFQSLGPCSFQRINRSSKEKGRTLMMNKNSQIAQVWLEHILEGIGLISDAASTERPSPITEYLFIGGALAASNGRKETFLPTMIQLLIVFMVCQSGGSDMCEGELER